MAELIQEYETSIIDGSGKHYIARAYGREREDGTWEGWFEFRPADGADRPVLITGQETSQPNLAAIQYWASGIEPVYLEGAFARASP